jgi:hypothetical protein
MHGPKESAIRARAKKYSWKKDLSEKIKKRINADIQRKAAPAGASDDVVVEHAALEGVQVLERHRVAMDKARSLVEGMFDEIREQAQLDTETIKQLIAALPQDLHSVAILAHKATTLAPRQKNVNGLIASLTRIIQLERQHYGLDTGGGKPPDGNELSPEVREALDGIYNKG